MGIKTIQLLSALPAFVRPSLPAVPPYASVVTPSVQQAPLPQAHRVPVQAELAVAMVAVNGGNGTTGFLGRSSDWSAKKRMTDGARGVPPRGRPV